MSGLLEHANTEMSRGRFATALDTLLKNRSTSTGASHLEEELLIAESSLLTGDVTGAMARADRGLRARYRSDVSNARFAAVLALAAFERGDIGESLNTFQRALSLARRGQDPRQACKIQLDVIANLVDLSGPDSIAGAVRECETSVANLGHPHLKARLHITIAQIEGKRGHLGQAEAQLRAAEGVLAVDPNAWLEGLLWLNLSTVQGLQTKLKKGIRLAERALVCAKESGHLRTRLGAIGNLAFFSLVTNDFASARSRCTEGLSMAAGSEVRIALLETLAQISLAEGETKECGTHLDKIEELASRDERYRTSWYSVATGLTRVRLHHRNAEWEPALRAGERGIENADGRRDRLHQISLRVLTTDALIELGHLDEAARLIDDAAALADDVPVAIFAEVERARAAVLARTTGGTVARRQFERSLRLLSAVGGIAPRMDAASSYQRTMQPARLDVRRETEAQPWNLEPLTRHTRPGSVRGPLPIASIAAARGLETTDILWLTRLIWQPELLAQETFVLLRESGYVGAIALVERRRDATIRLTAYEGWSADQARREAVAPDRSVRMPLGTTQEIELELFVEPAAEIRGRTFVRDFAMLLRHAQELRTFREKEREQSALLSPDFRSGNADGVFTSDSTRKLVATAKRVAPTNLPILITGETGTGKEVLARLIHKYSDRADRDFVPYNCTGVPKDMVDDQLFGHRRGAFTGARDDSLGVIRSASGGTLLLDEIGDIELSVQPKLLRFLDNSEVHPLGESRPVRTDVRVIAATNANLDDLVRDGRFREDLFYRLNIVSLELPPLRTRREEILPLVHHFLQRFGAESKRTNIRITEDAQKCLLLYEWPGNVRRLANEMRRAVALVEGDGPIGLEQLSPEVIEAGRAIGESVQSAFAVDEPTVTVRTDQPLGDAVAHLERVMIRRTLSRVGGHVSLAAEALGVSRKGFYLKRQRLGLDDC